MTKNLDNYLTERESKSWYEIKPEDRNKVDNLGDIYEYYEAFE